MGWDKVGCGSGRRAEEVVIDASGTDMKSDAFVRIAQARDAKPVRLRLFTIYYVYTFRRLLLQQA